MPMQAPSINKVQALKTPSIEQLSQNGRQNIEVGGGFSEVLDLVKPREIVRSDEHKDLQRADFQDDSHTTDVDQSETSIREGNGVQSEARAAENTSKNKEDQSSNVEATQKVAPEGSDGEKVDRADALKIIQQLSQEDLLKLIELSEGQNAHVAPELTAFEAEAIPAIRTLGTHELMALLHGFQDAQQPQLQSLATELLGQSHLQEQALTQGLNQHQLIQGLNVQVNQQVNQPQFNPNAIMPLMEAVVRPQEVMPALNQVKLNASQRDGIIRQVANGFRTKSGGTQTTEIRLNPEELGLVRLKVEMKGTDVRVFFSAENPVVMELLSENIDQLKALLTEQEFNLTEAGVWQDFHSQNGSQQQSDDEDYGSDERPDLRHRPKNNRRMSPLPGRFRATV